MGVLAEINHLPPEHGVQERHDRVSERAKTMLSILNTSKPLLLVGVTIGLCAAVKKYYVLRRTTLVSTAEGTVVGTATMVGQPVGLPTDEKAKVTTEFGPTSMVVVGGLPPDPPKVSMPAKDRLAIPKGFGMVELQNTSGEESAFEMVALLYENPGMRDGLARSEHLQKKLRDNCCEDKMIVYVPETDLHNLKNVWSSREIQEGRKNVMKETKQRAPRLSFFRNDGERVE